jgi:hypothetical protein
VDSGFGGEGRGRKQEQGQAESAAHGA